MSGKIDKCEYLKDEATLPFDQSTITEQAKFTYFPLSKAFEKEIKTIEEKWAKQVEAFEVLKPITQILKIKDVIPENALSEEAKSDLNKIKEIEKKHRQRKIMLQSE